jgi:hypothetical protein
MSDAPRRFKCVLHDEVGRYNQHQVGGRKTEGHPAQLHVIDFLDTGKRRSPGVEMGACYGCPCQFYHTFNTLTKVSLSNALVNWLANQSRTTTMKGTKPEILHGFDLPSPPRNIPLHAG